MSENDLKEETHQMSNILWLVSSHGDVAQKLFEVVQM